jgi:quinoprotein dehydrogenase-associated probable ABC transporter substrate-binding protein
MSSASERIARVAAVATAAMVLATPVAARAAGAQQPAQHSPAPLRVCADPNNLPFSNRRGEGFENELAQFLAHEMKRQVDYTWWPQRRGFVRNTLKQGRCDLVIGVPAGFELTATTRPYYRSSYALVSRRGSGLDIRSFDDPRLRSLRIGIHAFGDDYSNVPPAHALALRGLARSLRGYSLFGDYSEANPPRALIDAVANGEIDVAIAWGPLAGYFARRSAQPLDVYPLQESHDGPAIRMQFGIAMGTRREDAALRDEVQRVLDARADEIRSVLVRYGVPLASPVRQESVQGGSAP